MPHPAGFPPILAIVAVLVCAGLLTLYYQSLFPRPARWALVAVAFVVSMAVTATYAATLAPLAQRIEDITDAWSALRVMVLIAGLPEEAVKLLATAIALALFRRDLRPAEASQTALVVALGFAAAENMQYARAFHEAAVLIGAGRGVFASFIHSMMAMIQGYFLAGLVRSGWRRWHLPVIGYALAAAAHSAFDWGLVRPLIEYFRTNTIRPEVVMEAVPIVLPSILGVILVSLFLFRRTLKQSGTEDPIANEPAHLALRARWRRVGLVVQVIGIIGFLGSIALEVMASLALQGQPQPTELSQLSPEQLRNAIIATAILAGSPMLILFGWLTRQKQ